MKQLNERMRKRPIYDCIFDKYEGFHISEEEIVEVAQLEEDLARHEGQIRHYPDTYLGKIFFQGVEAGKKQLKAELQKSMDREYALDNNLRVMETENEALRERSGLLQLIREAQANMIRNLFAAEERSG